MYSNLNLKPHTFPDKNIYQAPVHIFEIYSRRSGSFIIVPCCGVFIFMVCSNDFGKVVGNVLAVIYFWLRFSLLSNSCSKFITSPRPDGTQLVVANPSTQSKELDFC